MSCFVHLPKYQKYCSSTACATLAQLHICTAYVPFFRLSDLFLFLSHALSLSHRSRQWTSSCSSDSRLCQFPAIEPAGEEDLHAGPDGTFEKLSRQNSTNIEIHSVQYTGRQLVILRLSCYFSELAGQTLGFNVLKQTKQMSK